LVTQENPLPGEGPIGTINVELGTYEEKKRFLKDLKDFDGITYFELA
jgi:hypothetical protein